MKRSKMVLICCLLVLYYLLIGIELPHTNTKFAQAANPILLSIKQLCDNKLNNTVKSHTIANESYRSLPCSQFNATMANPLDLTESHFDPKTRLYNLLDSIEIPFSDKRHILNEFDRISAETAKNISNVHANINMTTTFPHHHTIYYTWNPFIENNKNNNTKNNIMIFKVIQNSNSTGNPQNNLDDKPTYYYNLNLNGASLANGTVADNATTFQNFTQNEILDKVSPANYNHLQIELTIFKDSIIPEKVFDILETGSKNNSHLSSFSSQVIATVRDTANLSVPTK